MTQEVYQNINWEEVIPQWEEAVAKNPNANTGNSFLRELLPFIKVAKPKVSKTQSFFGGLTLICLEGELQGEDIIIDKGLQPLVENGILKTYEADKFRDWLKKRGYDRPSKKFSLEGIKYELMVDNYPSSYRDLLLRINTGDEGRGGYPRYCLATGCTAFGRDGDCYAESKCNWVPNQPKKEVKE